MYGWREGCGTREKGVIWWQGDGEECVIGKKGGGELNEMGVKRVS